MADIHRLPSHLFAKIEIFELADGGWVVGIGLPTDGGDAPRFRSHGAAVVYAAGFAAGSGLPVKDWSKTNQVESA